MLRITSFLLLTTLTIQISAVLNIPKPIYGVPDGIRYPPPPPDIPPPRPVYGVPDGNRYPQPQAEYGVPILKYGPPKVHFDHGISGPGQHQFPKKFPYQNGGHSKKPSFFDQIKSHFGLSGGSPQYGVPAPNFRPNQHFEHSVHHFESHGGSGFGGGKIPGPAYGVPSHSYGPPQQSYGPPQQSYGPPPQAYGVPHKHHGPSFGGQGGGSFGGGSFGGGSFGGGSLGGGHGSFVGGNGGHHSGPSFAPPRLVPCDGWKPIAGPIGNDDGGHINIQSHSIHLDHEADHADIITHAGFGGSDFNVVKSQGIELHDNSIGTDSFNIPPSGSYGVPSVGGSLGHSSGGSFSGGFGSSGSGGSFGSSGSGGSFGSSGRGSFGNSGSVLGGSYGTPISGPARQPSGSYIPSAGIQTIQLSPVSNPYVPPRLTTSYGPPPSGHYLTPPSGSYGVPQGGNNGGLAISHGSVSGNLKSWPVSGAAPVEPISFKEPLPQGLIESIGESVKQIDSLSNSVASAYTSNSGVQIQQSTDLSSGLYSLPLENSPRPFYQAHELPQFGRQLPLESNFNGHTDCNHGPIQDSYGPPPSGRSIQNQNLGAGSDINLVSSYGPPPSGFVDSSASSSSIQQDSVAHATQLRSSSDNSDDEDEESKSEENDVISSETAKSQQTDNFVIPVQGQLGSYQLQFQSANGLGGETSNRVPHQQLLSEGLLQQILSAIEQPNQSNIIVPQSTYDQHSNHQDVAAFLHSPTGRDTLAEPKKSK